VKSEMENQNQIIGLTKYPWQKFIYYLSLSNSTDQINDILYSYQLPPVSTKFVGLKEQYEVLTDDNERQQFKQKYGIENLSQNLISCKLFKQPGLRLILNSLILCGFSNEEIIDLLKKNMNKTLTSEIIDEYKTYFFDVNIYNILEWDMFFDIYSQSRLAYYLYVGAYHRNKEFVLEKLNFAFNVEVEKMVQSSLQLCFKKIHESEYSQNDEALKQWLVVASNYLSKFDALKNPDKGKDFNYKVILDVIELHKKNAKQS